MKTLLNSICAIFTYSILTTSCSNSNNQVAEKFNSIEKRYSMFMSYEGCVKNITKQNTDTSSRKAQLKLVSMTLPQTFDFLNSEINFLKTVNVTEENKEIVEKYNFRIGTLLSEHIKIFRLVFVELSNKKSDYWGRLSLEGTSSDILKQVYENKTQKSVMEMETNNLILMRFKKIILISPNNDSEEISITSPSDSELVPMKM